MWIILKVFIEFVTILLCFKFWDFGYEVRGVLAPQPGMEHIAPALEDEVLTTGPPGKSLHYFLRVRKYSSEASCRPSFTLALIGLCIYIINRKGKVCVIMGLIKSSNGFWTVSHSEPCIGSHLKLEM